MSDNELKTLFPGRTIELSDGRKIKMRPIPLKELPKVLESFIVVFTLKSQGVPPIQMLAIAFDAVIELVEACLVDASTDDMSSADAPFLLGCFIDQNLTETVLGKWRALMSRLGGMFPEVSLKMEGLPQQSMDTTPEQSQSPLSS